MRVLLDSNVIVAAFAARGICDALFEEDSAIAGGTCWKFWCESSKAHAEICVLYWKE